MKIEFNTEKHEYKVGGIVVPSVTQMLESAGFIDTRFFNESSATRGTYVHQSCEWLDNGELDEESLDPKLKGYIEGYKSFLEDTGAKVIANELRVYNKDLNYAGTLDKIIEMNGKRYLVDLKTGIPSDWHKLQLLAYNIAEKEMFDAESFPMIALYVNKEGGYKIKKMKGSEKDLKAIESASNLYHWKNLL